MDPHQLQKSKEVTKFLNTVGTSSRILKESTQHADCAELYIRLLKNSVRKDPEESSSPMKLWCYRCERRATSMTMTANNIFQLQGQNPHMATLGKMGDI